LLTSRPAVAYEFAVHFSLTMWLAETVGFSEAEAFEIAKYDQATDDNPLTHPFSDLHDSQGVRKRADYHFVGRIRLGELKRGARCAKRGAMTALELERIGHYLHALEDSYSHKENGKRLGHLFSWHTPDKPWAKPGDFVAMVQGKFQALLLLGASCARRPRKPEQARAIFEESAPVLRQWIVDEFEAGVDDPESPGRFEALARRLYRDRYGVYVEASSARYAAWRGKQGWRVP
jgi:hypothetical protein